MLALFSRTRYGPVGLDIGAESVKMLQLGKARGKPFVAAAALCRFPEGALGPEADLRLQSRSAGTGDLCRARRRLAAEAVREALMSGAFRGRDVVSCLRTDEMEIKNIRLPHMPEHELAGAAMWECQERFGFEVTPDRIHCIRAGEVRQGAEARDEVILMAVPDDGIRSHLEMLSAMRLRPVHIDTEPTALFRTYQRFLRRAEDNSIVTVIVDIGLAGTKVIVARGKTILLIKTINLAGRKFNESVAKELNMSYSEAADLRRRTFEGRSISVPQVGPYRDLPPEPSESLLSADASGNEASGRDVPASKGAHLEHQVEWSVFDAIREQIEALAREISLCLRYCSVTFRGLRLDRITLTGGEAYDPHLVRSLNEYLDCKCVVGQPLYGIDLGQADLGSDRRGELTEWSVAAGLALRGLWEEVGDSTTRSANRRSRVPAGEEVSSPVSGVSDRKADYEFSRAE